jgi:hypothetical protein
MIATLSALDIAQNYKIDLTREGQCYRAACPVCGRLHLTFAPSDRFSGYYFASPCYSQDGYHTGSGTNLDYWLRSLGATGYEAVPGYLPTEAKPTKPTKPLDAGKLARLVHGAMARLTKQSAGGQYLYSRHITRATARAWKLGFGFWGKYQYQSIVIPWYAPEHKLVGVSHRLIAPTADQPKAPWQPGMAGHTVGLLCGWHTHQERDTVIVVEGLLNAVSLYQTCADIADILTPGSENTNPATWDLAVGQWQRVVVWADKQETAAAWGRALGTKFRITSTPNGVKVDANDLLRRGNLRAFIESGLR